MTSLGVVFRPQLPPERLRSVVTASEEAGLEELWLWEDCYFESGVASMSAALGWSSRLRVGVGVLPVPMRNVAMTTMEVATLHRLFPGRVTIGLGHGNQVWMGQSGVRAASPLTLMREHLVAMKSLLRGERVTTEGRYVTLDDVALEWPPPEVPALYVGATGPKSMRLSGELADGTIIDAGNTAADVRRMREQIEEGRREAGRTDPHHLVVFLTVTTGPDAAARLRAERELWGNGAREDLGVAGDAATVAEAVAELVAAGAGTVIAVPTGDESDVEGLVRFVAQEVRPLVP